MGGNSHQQVRKDSAAEGAVDIELHVLEQDLDAGQLWVCQFWTRLWHEERIYLKLPESR